MAAALVEARLAACVNMIPQVESVYRWQGAVETDQEALLLVKSGQGRLPELIDAVRRLHPYENPEVIALPVVGGSGPYLAWIAESTKPAPPAPSS